MNIFSYPVSVSRSNATTPQLHIPALVSPPDSREAVGWCWAYYEVSAPCTVRLYSPSPDVAFSYVPWADYGQGIDLAFSPGSPLTGFYVMGQRGIGEPAGTIDVSIEVLA